jgi:hypothetical protein
MSQTLEEIRIVLDKEIQCVYSEMKLAPLTWQTYAIFAKRIMDWRVRSNANYDALIRACEDRIKL